VSFVIYTSAFSLLLMPIRNGKDLTLEVGAYKDGISLMMIFLLALSIYVYLTIVQRCMCLYQHHGGNPFLQGPFHRGC
jgi:hypothetical protein